MCGRTTCLMAVLLALGWVCVANAADIQFTDAGADHLWTNPENWKDAAGPPLTATDGAACKLPDTIVEITEGMNAVCKGFMLGMSGVTNGAEVSGGSLTCNWLHVGRVNQKGGNGYLLVTGGQITVNGKLGVPHQFNTAVDPEKIGVGHIDLLGGYIIADNFVLGNHQVGLNGGIGTMDITEGALYVVGDKTAEIRAWIDNGWITAYGGNGEFDLDYDVRYPGETSLTAFISENRAQMPSPETNSVDVRPEVTLSWSPGDNVQAVNGHDLYFGTAFDDVNDATRTNHPNVEHYNLNATSFGPLSLDLNQTYYWRVDQLNDAHPDKIWKGYLWNFTTIEHLTLDDFESYDGNPLPGVWTASGSATPGIETSEIHGGSQAMSVGYDDTSSAVIARGITGENWTKNGIEALYIWCKAGSDVAQLSVKLNNSGSEQVVSDLGRTSDWQRLLLDLSLFDIDLSSVSNIAIEITAVTGGAGTVYIDDITMYPCIAGGLAADFNDDCVVDFKDFAVFADSWLEEQYWPQ